MQVCLWYFERSRSAMPVSPPLRSSQGHLSDSTAKANPQQRAVFPFKYDAGACQAPAGLKERRMPKFDDIHLAARAGDIDALARLVAAGESIDSTDKKRGYTALMHACESASAGLDAVQWCIDHGADMNALTSPVADPIVTANETLEGLGLDKPADEIIEDTMREVGEGMDPKTRELMIEAMRKLEQTEPPANDESVLMICIRGGSSEKVQLLLEHGADVGFRSNDGYTPMIMAACVGSEEIIEILLEAGAPTDGSSSYGESVLSRLANDGSYELVKRLL